jgi:hypothetical protein
MLGAMSLLTLLPLLAIAALAAMAIAGRWRGRRFVVIPRSAPTKPDRPHRQAIHHFASGVLPPWR